jgi:hypothetical protein
MALRFIGRVGATALPKQVHFAGIELYKPESGANRRCFAGAVWPSDNICGRGVLPE